MKNPFFSFILFVATVTLGVMYYKANEANKGLESERERMAGSLKVMETANEKSKAVAEKSQKTSRETAKKLEKVEAQLVNTRMQLAKMTQERDQLKQSIASTRRKPNRTASNQAKPEPTTPAANPVKTGTLGLPPGISKGGTDIKRPGE